MYINIYIILFFTSCTHSLHLFQDYQSTIESGENMGTQREFEGSKPLQTYS